jgi:hypothetical protein
VRANGVTALSLSNRACGDQVDVAAFRILKLRSRKIFLARRHQAGYHSIVRLNRHFAYLMFPKPGIGMHAQVFRSGQI